MISASRGNGYQGDIAIDDINIDDGSCGKCLEGDIAIHMAILTVLILAQPNFSINRQKSRKCS